MRKLAQVMMVMLLLQTSSIVILAMIAARFIVKLGVGG